MRKSIYILTGYHHFFGQTRKPWVSINIEALKNELSNLNLEVIELPFHMVLNNSMPDPDSIIFYTFSQRNNLRHYIKDVVYTLARHGCLVIPPYQLLNCHENKGFQECLKKELGIIDLPAYYFSSKRELDDYVPEFPCVLKTLEGSNGKGVFLIRNKSELLNQIKQLEPKPNFSVKLDLLRRKYFRLPKQFAGYDNFDSRKDLEQYTDYITPEIGFILQKFIPGLQYDYRIIILGKHYYVTKRLVRKKDFRASGAKRFTFDFKASDALLDYASSLYERFDSPCLSIDIGEADDKYYLFEFQALHFGINAIVRGNGYYENTVKGWTFIQEKNKFEKELASSFAQYLLKKGII